VIWAPNWVFQGSGKSGNTNFGLGTYETSAVAATTGCRRGSANTQCQLGVAGAPSLGFTIFNASTAAILSLELQALEVDNRGKIVSNPRVVTTNLRPAVILQGEQIPVVTQRYGKCAATTTFKDALLCLLVNPQVLNNDSIILNVEVTKDARGARLAITPGHQCQANQNPGSGQQRRNRCSRRHIRTNLAQRHRQSAFPWRHSFPGPFIQKQQQIRHQIRNADFPDAANSAR
jgi:type II secretory pathway component HofQ